MNKQCPKCGHNPATDHIRLKEQLAQAHEENARLLKSLERIQSMCGNPDPAEACRLILKEAAKAARRGNGLAQA